MMKSEKNNLLNNVLKCYIDEQNAALQDTPSFLSIIGRSYDEDLISRFLAYILKNDIGFVGNLLKRYFRMTCSLEIKSVNVICEKTMNSGRVDIFAEITTVDREIYTLTIENKIYSGIHGTVEDSEQTETYYRFVSESYDKAKNAFYLLKPEYNGTQTKCKQFETISYDDIVELITINDYLAKDFIKHVKEHLTMKETKFTETDKVVLTNFSEYRTIMQSAENAINSFKNWLFRNVSKDIFSDEQHAYDYYVCGRRNGEQWAKAEESGGITNDIVDDVQCCKFYRVGRWYKWTEQCKADNYWFYVEIKLNDNDPRSIVVQSVMKGYGKMQESIVRKFCVSPEFKTFGKTVTDWSPYYVFDTIDVKNHIGDDTEPFSLKWAEKVKQVIVEQVARQISNMDKIFRSFEHCTAL